MTTDNLANSFVPEGFDAGDFGAIEPLLCRLLDRPIALSQELRRWLADLAELYEAIDEYETRRMIEHACHTDDEEKERAYLHFVREVEPKLKPIVFKLKKKFLARPQRAQLTQPGETMITRDWSADVNIFREVNVPLQTKNTELSAQYNKICGAMTVEYRGEQYTLQQMGRFLEEPDRDTREQAWRLVAQRRLDDRDRIEDIFDQMLDTRQQVAANADFADYRAYAWKAKKRFDYTPDDCTDFADAVEQQCMPLVHQIDGHRREALGLDTLRPWDQNVDLKQRPPLRPFDASDIDGFVDKTRRIFERIQPELGEQFDHICTAGNLDLDSRPAKRPGGFHAALQASRQPFIFMNAAGLQRDVDTLLHEGGHAFHYQAACDEQMLFTRQAPLEFCEVASMSMELLGREHYREFYGDDGDGRAEADRAKRCQLEHIVVQLLPWIATIDGFQHWLYTHPGHERSERAEAWRTVFERFISPMIDWSDLEDIQHAWWQPQLHLFNYPFYYIEYGIAQLGALQVWANHRRDPQKSLRDLQAALALGGSQPLPKLFDAAGIRFDFSRQTVEPMIAIVREELERLPR